VSGVSGPCDFSFWPDHPGGSGFRNINGGVVVKSHCVRLSDIVEGIGNKKPIVVKLDCEGSERSIFEDDNGWIKSVCMVVMEWHNHDGDYYRDILQSFGFDVFLEGGGPHPRPAWNKSIGGGLLIARRL
jgi:hypothetical protein